jgi:hypothetical protein
MNQDKKQKYIKVNLLNIGDYGKKLNLTVEEND